MYMYMYVCMYVCMYVRMYACTTYMHTYVHVHTMKEKPMGIVLILVSDVHVFEQLLHLIF